MLSEFAPAKLNLYLHVLGKDARGYHLLDSLVAFADIGDELQGERAASYSLSIEGLFAAGLDAESDNLVTRAAVAMAALADRQPDVRLTLVKNLPVASGIGGGSADAAATLRLLGRMWGIDPASPLVIEIARSLGSDVPVCLAGKACFMGGAGEVLDPCPPLPPIALVLANPGIPCGTREVFAARTGEFTVHGRFTEMPMDAAALVRLLDQRTNGLSKAALTVRPEIAEVLRSLEDSEGVLLARMLGSGATCLGFFADDHEAVTAAARIAEEHPEWWVTPGRLLQAGQGA